MELTNARWATPDQSEIIVEIDGAPLTIKATPGLIYYDAIVAAELPIAPYVPPPPTADHVAAERERRMALGFYYDFGAPRGVHHIGTTASDMKGWDEVTAFTQALMALGNTTQTVTIVTDTGPCVVTAPEWMAVLIAAAQFRQPLWAASFALQAMSPIPANYADDQWWP